MKWSDGEPFTADDIMFWYEDLYLNDDLNPSKASFMRRRQQGKSLRSTTPVAFKFDQPYYVRRSDRHINGRRAHDRGLARDGLVGPKHYLQQFHPKTDPAKLDAQAKRPTSTTGPRTPRTATRRATSIARRPRRGTSPRPSLARR
jgi:peptide/nickel transport system substrate-binding protein